MATLDGAVKRFSQWIEALVDEKKALETQVETKQSQLETEEMRRNTFVEGHCPCCGQGG